MSSNTGCAGDSDSIGTTNFFDQIQAFTCGLFGDNNMFCFIYVLTHNDKIMIVHSIEITNTNTKNLLAVLDEKYEDGKFKEINYDLNFYSNFFFFSCDGTGKTTRYSSFKSLNSVNRKFHCIFCSCCC